LSTYSVELLASVKRGSGQPLRRQIEDQLRRAIRSCTLKLGSPLASTRDFARQLGVSRPVVVQAYAQLAAEGYIVIKRGARPRVARCIGSCRQRGARRQTTISSPKVDFRPASPDLSAFPRSAWLRSLRAALATMPNDAFGHGDPMGEEALRQVLAEYLGRVRGLVADADRLVVVNGHTHGRGLVCRMLKAAGVKRVAVEDPCQPGLPAAVESAGLKVLPIPIDCDGIDVHALYRSPAEAVFLTPAHQFPIGAVMSGERRTAVLGWLRDRDAIAVENDYDAEYRYDRPPVSALQALEPDRIVYEGTTSQTLAPALQLAWLVVPPALLATARRDQDDYGWGAPRIEQYAFADFLLRGELDRHLRRQRASYRSRRDALLQALKKSLPEATVCGISAGLHATIAFPKADDERAIQREAQRRGVAVSTLSQSEIIHRARPPMLVLGYANVNEATIGVGVNELAAAVRAARLRRPVSN
jgi:GntR family transcriptional regulator/MocR family aminotransferase